MINFLINYWWVMIVLIFIVSGFMSVLQGNVAVVTMFGKYRRVLRAGLNFKIPFLEQIHRYISIQNFSFQQSFQAITGDQANIFFNTNVVYSLENDKEETIKKASFLFISDTDLLQAVFHGIEATIRAFVATRTQENILSMRDDVQLYIKQRMDIMISEWGYKVSQIQITDIVFDPRVMRSMSAVVESKNLKIANDNIGKDQQMFNRWCEAMENFAKNGTGNTIFMDATAGSSDKQHNQLMGMINKNTQV